MQERAQGLILRLYPLTESSLIVHWLTAEFGRIATVAKGARKPKSSFSGKLDLYFDAEFSFVRSRRSQLHTLTEVTLRDSHTFLRRDLGALRQLAYAATLIEQTTEQDTPFAEGRELLRQFLDVLARIGSRPMTLCIFETEWLRCLGQEPIPEQTQLRPPARATHRDAGTGVGCNRLAGSACDAARGGAVPARVPDFQPRTNSEPPRGSAQHASACRGA